jgi:hypothetical protein
VGEDVGEGDWDWGGGALVALLGQDQVMDALFRACEPELPLRSFIMAPHFPCSER